MNSNKQILLDSKVARLLLRQLHTKNKKPFLVDAFVHKLIATEGIKPSIHIYDSSIKPSKETSSDI